METSRDNGNSVYWRRLPTDRLWGYCHRKGKPVEPVTPALPVCNPRQTAGFGHGWAGSGQDIAGQAATGNRRDAPVRGLRKLSRFASQPVYCF